MNNTYGFVEEWLAQFLDIEFLHYPLDSGGTIAAIDDAGFQMMERKIVGLWEEFNQSDLALTPRISTCVIEGMVVLLHSFWVNDDIFDEVTSEAAKDLPVYHSIKALGPSGSRFSFDDIKNKMAGENEPDPVEEVEQVNTDEALPAEAEAVEEAPKEKPIPKLSEEEIGINNFLDTIKNVARGIGGSDSKYDGEYRIIQLGYHIPDVLIDSFIKLASVIQRNIILVGHSDVADYVTKKMKKTYDMSRIQEHTVILVMGSMATDFSYYSSGSTICYGHSMGDMYTLHSDGYANSEITKIRGDTSLNEKTKSEKVAKILSLRENTPLHKYDAVYKDTVTGAIWAVKDRCIIYLMVDILQRYNKFYVTALSELALRFDNKLPYEALVEIDQAYLDQMSDGNKEDYIQFSVTNSQIILDELKKKRDEHYNMYVEFHTKAMEHAKIFRKFDNQISYFDQSKFVNDEKKKAEDNYEHTLDLDNVSAIVIKDNTVCVYTHNIYVQDERSQLWHDIGTFQIEIGMHSNAYDSKKTVRIHNTKYQVNAFLDNMQAPHVYGDGHICHGNLATGMTDAYSRRDMFGLVYQILLFISSANTSDGAGQYVNKWPEVTEDTAKGRTPKIERENDEKMKKLMEAEAQFDDQLADSIPINL